MHSSQFYSALYENDQLMRAWTCSLRLAYKSMKIKQLEFNKIFHKVIFVFLKYVIKNSEERNQTLYHVQWIVSEEKEFKCYITKQNSRGCEYLHTLFMQCNTKEDSVFIDGNVPSEKRKINTEDKPTIDML